MKRIPPALGTKRRMMAAALACLALFAGCSFAPHYAKPAVSTPVAFKEPPPEASAEGGSWTPAAPRDDALRGAWWELYRQPELNALEEQAVLSNQTIAVACANFLAARAVVQQTRAQFFPTLTAAPSATRARLASSRGASSASPTVTTFALPFDASWELDFWGRIRNSVNASKFEAEAVAADLENVRLSVQAELAVDYFQIGALDAQTQLLDAAVRGYEESLKLTQVRHDTGIASDQDVAQAETQLNITRTQATDLGIQRAQLEHALATLLGKPACVFAVAANALAAHPVAIPFGVPSRLLERRPDIAAAERRVAEANAQIGVARAAYFPAITLSGAAGYQNAALAHLVSGPHLVWSVGAAAAETLFDAGKRSGVTAQAWASYQGTVANYRQTVLAAFQDVEDNLSTLRILSQELREQDAAVASSQRYLTLANDRYKFGIDSYLNVITAQTTLLDNQRTALNLRMQQMTASVQLIKALGGGWERPQGTSKALPSSRDVR